MLPEVRGIGEHASRLRLIYTVIDSFALCLNALSSNHIGVTKCKGPTQHLTNAIEPVTLRL